MRYEEFKLEDIEVGDELQWKESSGACFVYGQCYEVISVDGMVVIDNNGSGMHVGGTYANWNLIKRNSLPKVQSLPPFKNMKFRVENEEHSEQIQEYLFSIGYKWDGDGIEIDIVPVDTVEYILTDSSGWIDWDYIRNFNEDFREEYKLTSHTTYSIEPVIPKIEVVNILGKQYNKADVEELLKTLEEVK